MRYSLQELTVREMMEVFKTLVKWFGMLMKDEERILSESNEQSMVERTQKSNTPRLEHVSFSLCLMMEKVSYNLLY